jgi:hypothetical protein
VFHLAMRAGLAVRAVCFHLAMRAGVAVRALAFQLAVWAGVTLRAVVFQLAVRTPLPSHPRGVLLRGARVAARVGKSRGVVAFVRFPGVCRP